MKITTRLLLLCVSFTPFALAANLPVLQPYTAQHIADALAWTQTGHTHNTCQGYYHESAILTEHPNPAAPKKLPTHFSAKGPTLFARNGASILRDHVVIVQPGRVVTADKAMIYRNGKTGKITHIILTGHVHLEEYGKRIVAPYVYWNMQTHAFRFRHPVYHVAEQHLPQLRGNQKYHYDAFGVARYAERLANGVLKLWNASYSTCSPLMPFWQIRAGTLTLNKKKGVASGRNLVLRIKKIPVFFTPYFRFPLNHDRHSGFLTPSIGHTTHNGVDIALPFYWNIAPNADATFTARYMTERGLQGNVYFRFLTHNSTGHFYASGIQDDRGFTQFQRNTAATFSGVPVSAQYAAYLNSLANDSNNRGYIAFFDSTQLSDSLSAHINVNYLSDPYYFKDFGVNHSTVQANQLLNQIDVAYTGLHWNTFVMLQSYQTLHLIDQITSPPQAQYSRLPEIDINGFYPNVIDGFNVDVSVQAVNFVYQNTFPIINAAGQTSQLTFQMPIGQRVHIRPSISHPFNWASGYFVPQLFLDSTNYYAGLPTPGPGQARPHFSHSRNIPIINLDGGLYYDRHLNIHGHALTQTLEPRLFYLYVPFVTQTQDPVYDTQLLPFTQAQLFALNRFSGFDRLDNANQITTAISSRLVSDQTGNQLLNATVGIITYFSQPSVTLPNTVITRSRVSPLVGQATLYPCPHWSASASAAWDTAHEDINNATATLTYTRDHTHVLTLGYTFVREIDGIPFDSLGLSNNTTLVNVGAAWPLNKQWSALAYWYYNVARRRPESYYLGLQFSTCCWAIRFLASRSYTGVAPGATVGNVVNQFNTTYRVQVLLKGLSNIGNGDASTLLTSTLPGYEDPFTH